MISQSNCSVGVKRLTVYFDRNHKRTIIKKQRRQDVYHIIFNSFHHRTFIASVAIEGFKMQTKKIRNYFTCIGADVRRSKCCVHLCGVLGNDRFAIVALSSNTN